MTKYILSAIGAVILVLALYGAYQHSQVTQTFGASPAGSTFGDAKQAVVAVNLVNIGANGTSTSILNTDVNDRYITSTEIGCNGVATSATINSLVITIATTSASAPATTTNTNLLPSITISSSSPVFVFSSSTAATPGTNLARVLWNAGSYLTFFSNATNTATCSLGVRYLSA